MQYFFQNIKNSLDFFLRQKVCLSRKNYSVNNDEKDGLFSTAELAEVEEKLIEKYKLLSLKTNSTRNNYLENLYTIDLLDKYLEPNFKAEMKVLDVGCKNWFYAKGEYLFFKKYCEKLTLNGIELDGNRLYSNLYSRKEVAKYHIKGLAGVNYSDGDFLKHGEKYDYIIWFLPFVFEYPHLKWGLPLSSFQPQKMLEHAYNQLNDGGRIFIINQGKDEFERQKELCESVSITYLEIGKVQSDFLNYKYDRYLLILTGRNYAG